MKFSIVTISYNQARFLEQAIRSVIEQDYPDVEYIVVDPGSTDGSRDIIERYRDRIDKIIFEPDNGPADGLNKGFAAASGDIYGFLNSDDVLEAGTFSHILWFYRRRPDIDVVSGSAWITDVDGRKRRRLYSDVFSTRMAAYGASLLVQPSTFFKASAFEAAGGFNRENRTHWDGELFIDMALAGARFGRIPQVLSQYRVHSLSNTGSMRNREHYVRYNTRMLEKILGRSPVALDAVIGSGARYLRKILNPRDTVERVLRGSISSAAGVR